MLYCLSLVYRHASTVEQFHFSEKGDIAVDRVAWHRTQGNHFSEGLWATLGASSAIEGPHSDIARHPDNEDFGMICVSIKRLNFLLIFEKGLQVEIRDQIRNSGGVSLSE